MDKTIGDSLNPSERQSAETVDAPASSLVNNSGRPWREVARRQVALVEGSSPHLSVETRDLLRLRLRMAAILLSIGFLVFLPRQLFRLDQLGEAATFWQFVIYLGTTGLLVLSSVLLCRGCVMPLGKLRFAEFAVFGAPAIYFVAKMYQNLHVCATLPDNRAFIPPTIGGWLLLIFVYAMFIPNTWQRALAVLATMGIAPLVVNFAAETTCPAFAQLVQLPEYDGYFVEYAMLMALAVMIATVGVHTIGSLRREAFAARQLGQYRLKQRLGSGGMGEVYLAEHQMMKRPCAIKVIHADKAGDPRALARFEREVRMTAKLSHWNSIDIFDYGRTADGTFYYVMEFLPGHNIGELVDDYGPLPAGRVIHLMVQTCAALSEAHGIGLIHRDIKPANIFCAYRGGVFDVAKLLDFGLAKPMMESQENIALTRDGAVTGSPLFMSPEQATGKSELDARSDIYSLGAVIYFMLTGRPPFDYDNPIKVMVAHASENIVPPREISPEVPEALEEVVLRCLEKDPDHRFQDATSLRHALLAVEVAEPWSFDTAAEWWSCNGCPQRKALAAELVEAAAV